MLTPLDDSVVPRLRPVSENLLVLPLALLPVPQPQALPQLSLVLSLVLPLVALPLPPLPLARPPVAELPVAHQNQSPRAPAPP